VEKRTLKDYLLITAKGLGMGAADVVPGVSGGTIAFITGIYEELIETIKNVNFGLLKIVKTDGLAAFWKAANGNFLVALVAGIGISVVGLAKVVTYLLIHQEVLLWSFFFGLIVASIVLILKKVAHWNVANVIGLLIGIALGYLVTLLAPSSTPDSNAFIFVAGAIAICAMILPGISGGFLLLIMGKYDTIIGAIGDLNVKVLGFFAAGAVVGLLSFSKLLSFLFKRYYFFAICFLSGIMIGSLNKVWPWKHTLEFVTDRHGKLKPLLQENVSPFAYEGEALLLPAIGMAVFGLVLVLVMEWKGGGKPEKA